MPDWSTVLNYSILPWLALLARMPALAILLQIVLVWCGVFLFHRFGTLILARIVAPFPFSRRLVRYGHNAGRMAVFLFVLQIFLRDDTEPGGLIAIVRHVNALGLIVALTWLGVRCIKALADTIVELNPVDLSDNLRARRIQTQTRVLSRSVMVMIGLAGLGLALTTLPQLRQIGASLLASAGVAGLVVGFAARPVLSNLLAGIQLALTQPIRLEDVVIVENEWGNVEEITGTYVVVRIWDQRRMIVPLQWFIEHPFQNWTRTNADILGTVLLWVDYRLPLEPLRREAERLCQAAPEWDGRLCLVQVVEAGAHAMQLRALVSAGDASRCWDLRCRVREGLLDFIRRDYPECLPRLRAEVTAVTPAS